MKPCIILWSKLHQRYEAYNEDGVKLHHGSLLFLENAAPLGFEVVPLNSRLGHTILDKIDARKSGCL